MYITIGQTDDQCKFDAWSRALKAGALGQRSGRGVQEGGHLYTRGRFTVMYGKTTTVL